jgi:hypothetical protein
VFARRSCQPRLDVNLMPSGRCSGIVAAAPSALRSAAHCLSEEVTCDVK